MGVEERGGGRGGHSLVILALTPLLLHAVPHPRAVHGNPGSQGRAGAHSPFAGLAQSCTPQSPSRSWSRLTLNTLSLLLSCILGLGVIICWLSWLFHWL